MVDADKSEVHGRSGALAALQEVAQSPAMQAQYSIATDSFEDEDYEQLIALAWRYQFDDSRVKFRQELRELQEHVSEGILARMELNKE